MSAAFFCMTVKKPPAKLVVLIDAKISLMYEIVFPLGLDYNLSNMLK